MNEFNSWLAKYLNSNSKEVAKLLENKSAIEFLITWSIFESSCFDGFLSIDKISEFSKNKATHAHAKSNAGELDVQAIFFHERYQNKTFYRNLLHAKLIDTNNFTRMNDLLNRNHQLLDASDKIFLLTFVVYRYRNNIFHGNKGVDSWLKFSECIERCTKIMQIFIPAPKNHNN